MNYDETYTTYTEAKVASKHLPAGRSFDLLREKINAGRLGDAEELLDILLEKYPENEDDLLDVQNAIYAQMRMLGCL